MVSPQTTSSLDSGLQHDCPLYDGPDKDITEQDKTLEVLLQEVNSQEVSPLYKNYMEDHLVAKIKRRIGWDKAIVFGRRGGFFGPENSMSGFQKAIEYGVEGIEFDVSTLFSS